MNTEQTTLQTRASLSSRCTALCGMECLPFLLHARADIPTGNSRSGRRSPPCLLSLDHASASEPPRLSPAVKQNQRQMVVISSNRILMSCQPHRVTSGQSNSGHKQMHISKLFSQICIDPLSGRSTKPITSQTCVYANITQNFEELFPSILPLLSTRLGHAGIIDHSI